MLSPEALEVLLAVRIFVAITCAFPQSVVSAALHFVLMDVPLIVALIHDSTTVVAWATQSNTETQERCQHTEHQLKETS